MATQRHIPLSDNHRRAIGTTLTLLDERLCEFEQIARGRETRSVFYQESNDLSAAQRKRLLQEIARARETMREIQDTLHLEPRVEILSRQVRAASSSSWEAMIETESKRLRGYGKVPQALAEYLDPSIGQLTSCLLRIISAAEGRKDSRGADGGGRSAHVRRAQEGKEAKP